MASKEEKQAEKAAKKEEKQAEKAAKKEEKAERKEEKRAAKDAARAEKQAYKDEDREQFGRGGSAQIFKLKEKVLAIGDDFWIEDESGQRRYKVDGKALALTDRLVFEDLMGQRLVEMDGKVIHIRGQLKLDRINGESAVVVLDLINIVNDHMTMVMDGGDEYDIRGNLLDHEYEIKLGFDKVCEISKRWFRIGDTYGVQIEPGADEILFLAATVAVDQLAHDMLA